MYQRPEKRKQKKGRIEDLNRVEMKGIEPVVVEDLNTFLGK